MPKGCIMGYMDTFDLLWQETTGDERKLWKWSAVPTKRYLRSWRAGRSYMPIALTVL
jgi:hypothetical protein